MAEKKTTQTQQNAGPNPRDAEQSATTPNNPFAQPFLNAFFQPLPTPNGIGLNADMWQQVMVENARRYDAMAKELFELEKRTLDNAGRAIDEIARLTKESLAYSQTVTEQWHAYAQKASAEFMPKN